MKNCKKTVRLFGSPGSFWTEKSITLGRPSEIGIIKNYPTEKRMTAIILILIIDRQISIVSSS